jgi:hypothetical protein
MNARYQEVPNSTGAHHTSQIDVSSSPWHVCVHGLGLGSAACSEADIQPLLSISATLLQRNPNQAGQWVVHTLLELLTAAAGGHTRRMAEAEQRVLDLLPRLAAAKDRAHAAAAALQVLAQLGAEATADSVVRLYLRHTLRDLLEGHTGSERECYHCLSAAIQLLDAANLACRTMPWHQVQLNAHFESVMTQVRRLERTFHRQRLTAVLLDIGGARPWRHQELAGWTERLDLLLQECTELRGPLLPADEIHTGLDYLCFPLSLTLRTASRSPDGRRLAIASGAVDMAQWLCERLGAASKASQLALLIDALARLDAVPARTLRTQLSTALEAYLHCSSLEDADAYLRATYLIYAAQRLDCLERVSFSLYARLNHAVTVSQRPASGYFSLPMVIAYTLYARALGPAPRAMLAQPGELAALLEHGLAPGAVPADEAGKLNHALLHLALAYTARALWPITPATLPAHQSAAEVTP